MKNTKGKHTFDGTKMNYVREDRQYIFKKCQNRTSSNNHEAFRKAMAKRKKHNELPEIIVRIR